MVLADHADVVVSPRTAQLVGFHLGGFLVLDNGSRVFLLHHQRTSQIVESLRIISILGKRLPILHFGLSPLLLMIEAVALTDALAVCLGLGGHGHKKKHIYQYLSHFLLNNLTFLSNGFRLSNTHTSIISSSSTRMPKAWNCSSYSL